MQMSVPAAADYIKMALTRAWLDFPILSGRREMLRRGSDDPGEDLVR
jgi:hypothetical protein